MAPGKKAGAGPRIGPARIGVPDIGGEEFDVTPAGRFALGRDDRRDYRRAAVLHHGGLIEHDYGLAAGLLTLFFYHIFSRMIKDVIMREIAIRTGRGVSLSELSGVELYPLFGARVCA